MENKKIKHYDSEFVSSGSLLKFQSCISSQTTTNSKKKPGGWKAMPYILGISKFFFLKIVHFFG